MTPLPRFLPLLLVLGLLGVLPSGASAATKRTYPSITKVSPLKLGVGQTLTLRGKHFRTGKGRNTVVFKRNGGRPVFIKAGKSTRTSISVVIPAKLLSSLAQKSGKPIATRFRLRVLANRLGRSYTSMKSSPMIGPKAVGGGKAVSADDCDGDTVKNGADADDDNDLLSDALESTLKTDACKRDSDGDGMSDGWEHQSALDYNGRAQPTPLRRPYPNALDGKDGAVDADGDGLTNAQEYAAWASFGRNSLTLNYSGGNPATGGKVKSAGREWADRDGNGFFSDNERDADGDGLPNQEEDLVDGWGLSATPRDANQRALGVFSGTHIGEKVVQEIVDFVPLYGALGQTEKVLPLSWLDTDSDGDTVPDGADDQDGDDQPNLGELLTEIGLGTRGSYRESPINACEPSTDAPRCLVGDDDIDRDGRANRVDDDDDGDRLSDDLERQLNLNPFREDTDEDGVGDGFEYLSAEDLNGVKYLPSAEPVPYPNPLDKQDAGIDHDGDGLTLKNEYRAWKFTGAPVPLSYSDGNQNTGGGAIDAYKDVDGDGASNFAEVAGPLSGPEYWTAWVKDNRNRCQNRTEYVESTYPGPRYKGLSFVDADSDGDDIPDGADDIDHDGLSNLQESRWLSNPSTGEVGGVRRPDWCEVYVSTGPSVTAFGFNDPADPFARPDADRYARIDPFNPCKPVYSEACHKFVPLSYYVKTDTYVEDWAGAAPVPGYVLP